MNIGVILLLVWLLFTTAKAQTFPELKLQTFFGSATHKERPYRIIKGSGKDFYILGSRTDSLQNEDGLIYHISDRGELLWQQIFQGKGNDWLEDGCYHHGDACLYYVGATGTALKHEETSDPLFSSDYWVGKIDPSGKVLWNKAFGGTESDIGKGIIRTESGHLIVCGNSWSSDLQVKCNLPLNNDWLIKLSDEGQLLTQKCWGGKKNDWAVSISASADKGFIIAGITTSEELDNSKSRSMGDVYIQKLDSNLKVVWTRIFKEPYEDHIFRVIEGAGGMIYAIGSTFTKENDKQFWLLKLNEKGETIVNKKWGGKGIEELTSVYECIDGELIMCGYSFYTNLANPFIKGSKDIWVFKTDGVGNLVWQKTYGGPKDEYPADVVEGEPDWFYVVGTKENTFTNKDKSNKDDIWLLKIKELPCNDIKPLFVTDIHGNQTEIDVPIKFINQSVNCERFLWEFGDGTTSTEKMPVKIYKKAGMYLPRLTAYTNEKCIQVYVSPKAVIVQ